MRRFTFLLLSIVSMLVSAQTTKTYRFDIPAQEANSAIVELALQRNLNIVFLDDLTGNVQTQAVVGDYGMQQALNLMLNGTGLRAKIANNRAIQIEKLLKKPQPSNKKPKQIPATKKKAKVQEQVAYAPPQIERIEVVGKLTSPYHLGETSSSTKTQREFLELPQIVAALPDTLIQDTGARNYSDASQLVSSVSYLERNAGITDELRLRGFAYPALKVNGISSHAYVAPIDIAFIESMEIAKGPNSVIFGRMEPGGVINMMTKKPNGQRNSVLLSTANDDYRRAELDLSWSMFNETDARIVGFYQRQGTEEAVNLNDAEGAMIAVAHQFDHGGTLAFNYRYQSQQAFQRFGNPVEGFDTNVQFFANEEGGLDVIASREDDLRARLELDRESINISLEDWLIGQWSADFHLQYDSYQSRSAINYPVLDTFIIDVNGESISEEDLTEALLADPELFNVINSGLQSISIDVDNLSYETVPFSYDTKALSAELTLYNVDYLGPVLLEQLYGININRSEPESLIWQTHDTRGNFLPIEQNEVLFDPDLENRNIEDNNAAIFSQWTLNWHELTAFLGARIDKLDFRSINVTGDVSAEFTESSFRAGIVYKLANTSSIYANYSESFSPQFDVDEAPLIEEDQESASRIIFISPANAHQFEIGIKKSWFNEQLQSSCNGYRIIKSGIDSIIYEQKNEGIECDLAGSFGQGWHVTLGVSFMDSEITESTSEEVLGNRPRMTPEKQIRLWLSRDFTAWFDIPARWHLGYTYIDDRFIDTSNEDLLPSYSLVDAGLTLNINHWVSLSISGKNLSDERYTAGAFNALPFWTNQGQSRTYEARLKLLF